MLGSLLKVTQLTIRHSKSTFFQAHAFVFNRFKLGIQAFYWVLYFAKYTRKFKSNTKKELFFEVLPQNARKTDSGRAD